MTMVFNRNKKVFEFNDTYAKEFIENHQKNSQWNESQLQVLVETVVNGIDTITENFMLNGKHLGSIVWILEQLKSINDYMKDKNHHFLGEDKATLIKLQRPFQNYRELIGKNKHQSSWLGCIQNVLFPLHQLCLGWFGITGVKLEKLQGKHATDEQHQEAHVMIDEIFSEAITTLKKSQVYQKAAQSNRLYYDILANLPEAELEDLSPEQLKDLPLPKKESPLTNQTKMMLFKQKSVPMKQETQTTAVKRKATDKLKQDENSGKYIVNVKKQKLNT